MLAGRGFRVHPASKQIYYRLEALGLDLITNEVLLLWLAGALTFTLLWAGCRRKGVVAHGPLQNFFESLIEFLQREVVTEGIGEQGRKWSAFLLTLFFFILFSNLLGLVPGLKSVTGNINVTGALAIIVFAVTLWINLRSHGLWGFMKKFNPKGVPLWLAPMVVPIEIVTWLMKPVSLAIRLFANMMAGHMVIAMFLSMAAGAGILMVKPLPAIGAVAMSAFEIFVCFVQAFIFTMLAGLYIREALEAH
jgi:F-type H+-transporting ATPase subunit a